MNDPDSDFEIMNDVRSVHLRIYPDILVFVRETLECLFVPAIAHAKQSYLLLKSPPYETIPRTQISEYPRHHARVSLSET